MRARCASSTALRRFGSRGGWCKPARCPRRTLRSLGAWAIRPGWRRPLATATCCYGWTSGCVGTVPRRDTRSRRPRRPWGSRAAGRQRRCSRAAIPMTWLPRQSDVSGAACNDCAERLRVVECCLARELRNLLARWRWSTRPLCASAARPHIRRQPTQLKATGQISPRNCTRSLHSRAS